MQANNLCGCAQLNWYFIELVDLHDAPILFCFATINTDMLSESKNILQIFRIFLRITLLSLFNPSKVNRQRENR